MTFLNWESGDLLGCHLHLNNTERKFQSKNKPLAGLCPHSWADGKLVDGLGRNYGSLVIDRCRTHRYTSIPNEAAFMRFLAIVQTSTNPDFSSVHWESLTLRFTADIGSHG